MAPKILEGVRVLDLTIFQLGPVNGTMLASMGAEVIHIEAPMGGPGRGTPWHMPGGDGKGFNGSDLSGYFEYCNRGKKSLVLDLKRPKAREVLYKLVEKSDVFTQNMRTGVADKLGCSYEELKKHNPKLIYCSGTAFGAKGPDGAKPGFDYSGACRSGAMWLVPAENGEPVHPMAGSFDQIGAIMGAFGIMAALYARDKYGIGQKVEVSHLSATMWLTGLQVMKMAYTKTPSLVLPRSKTTRPMWNHYKCKDGEWIALCMLIDDRHWPVVCPALGIPESWWKDDSRFSTTAERNKNAKEAVGLFEEKFASKDREEWAKIFEGKDIFWERVQRIDDLPADPQVIANEYMTDYKHPLTDETYKYLMQPYQLSETPADIKGRAPILGEHTAEILKDVLGYKEDEIPQLIEEIGKPVGAPSRAS
jgi:crotonobetainyl-CoA:carnitine CoA-transferase CaiB-like acyl-CoA transferase